MNKELSELRNSTAKNLAISNLLIYRQLVYEEMFVCFKTLKTVKALKDSFNTFKIKIDNINARLDALIEESKNNE